MLVETINVTRRYRHGTSVIDAVKDVNLTVDAAEFVAIVGPSGSGKTTLLNLMGLLDYPSSGTILFQTHDTSRLSPTARRQIRFQHIGFIFQTFNLIPTLTALENVELPMAFANRSQHTQKTRARALLDAVGLTDRLDHKPAELSSGEMQRVAIARALTNQPALLLADEPTGELDSTTGSDIIRLLLDLCRQRHTTVIVATHDANVVDVADTTHRMCDGVIH
jgi:putative ABC transport system ATP-binding protein